MSKAPTPADAASLIKSMTPFNRGRIAKSLLSRITAQADRGEPLDMGEVLTDWAHETASEPVQAR